MFQPKPKIYNKQSIDGQTSEEKVEEGFTLVDRISDSIVLTSSCKSSEPLLSEDEENLHMVGEGGTVQVMSPSTLSTTSSPSQSPVISPVGLKSAFHIVSEGRKSMREVFYDISFLSQLS